MVYFYNDTPLLFIDKGDSHLLRHTPTTKVDTERNYNISLGGLEMDLTTAFVTLGSSTRCISSSVSRRRPTMSPLPQQRVRRLHDCWAWARSHLLVVHLLPPSPLGDDVRRRHRSSLLEVHPC